MHPGFFFNFSQILIFGVNRGAKEQKMTWNYNCNYVSCTPYLIKHVSYDRVFGYTSLKWCNIQMFFSFFSKFFWVVKVAQNDKIFCLALYLRNCSSYDCGFWCTCVKSWYLKQFFSFFQKSDFLGFSEFINVWRKEILRCAPPSSHMCDLKNNHTKSHLIANSI